MVEAKQIFLNIFSADSHFRFMNPFHPKRKNSQILDKRIGIRMVPPPKQGD